MSQLSEVGRKSPVEWASEVPESQHVSMADLERFVANYHGASEEDLIPGEPREGSSNLPGWVIISGMLAILIVPLFGAAQYWGGGGGVRGGNLSVAYDPGRASVIVPICFGLMSLALVYFAIEWVRDGRSPSGAAVFYPLYFGGCAGLGLLLAVVRHVSFANGGALELISMWVCLAAAAGYLGGYFLGVNRTEEARRAKSQESLRNRLVRDRNAAGRILVDRGILDKSDRAGMGSPFGSFMLGDERK